MHRYVSLFAIVGQFAIQLASVPHAHAGMSAADQRQHNAVPHFHCDWLVGGHLQQGSEHRHQDTSGPLNTAVAPEGWNAAAHDATAVHCLGKAIAVAADQQQVVNLSLLIGADALAVCQLHSELDLDTRAFGHERPPDEVIDGSNRYLQMRNLRL